MQLPCVIEMAANAFFHKASIAMTRLCAADQRQRQPADGPRHAAAARGVREERVLRPLVRHHVPERAAGRLQPERRRHPRRARRRRLRGRPAGPALPAARQQDVDLGRRARAHREHRAPGAGEDRRRRGPHRARHQGHLAVHRAQAAGRCRRPADRRAQRRRAGRAEPQARLPRHHQHAAELRRRPLPAARRGRRHRLPRRLSRAKACAACST